MDRRGWTLPELTTVLLLLGLAGGVAVTFLHNQRAVVSVRSAARALEGASFEARRTALLDGRAELVIQGGATPRAWIEPTGRDTLRFEVWGVDLDLKGGASEARIRYGPDGLGQVASRTVTLTAGAVQSDLVISSYGRVEIR